MLISPHFLLYFTILFLCWNILKFIGLYFVTLYLIIIHYTVFTCVLLNWDLQTVSIVTNWLGEDIPPVSLKCFGAYTIRTRKLNLWEHAPLMNYILHLIFFGAARLVQKLWRCKVGVWQSGGFCKGLVLAQGGSVANRAFESSSLYCTSLCCTSLNCTLIHFTTIYGTSLHCISLHCTSKYRISLYCT